MSGRTGGNSVVSGLALTPGSRAMCPGELPRRGMILFVVVAMLALFAVVSVAFYYYATQESTTSRIFLDSQNRTRPDPDALLAYALRMLIFDEAGDGPFKSHIATHSLLRNLFGSEGLEPFSGTGRLHGRDYSYYSSSYYYDTYYATCYVNRSYDPAYDPARDGSCNPPYTFPDFNHCFLGRITTDGPTGPVVILEQSFIRRSVPGSPGLGAAPPSNYFDPYDPANIGFWNDPNWPNRPGMPVALRQAIVFRPHPLLHPRFPPPADIGGDVRNLPPGIPVKVLRPDPKTGQLADTGLRHYGNDSIWMDLGFPVQTGPDGRTYKPLFAFFITDLDGRLNLNQVFWNPEPIFASGESRPGGLNGHHEMEAILRHGDTLADSFTSLLFANPNLQQTMKDLRRRHMLTTHSADLRYAGFVPQIYREPWDGSPTQIDKSRKNNIVYPEDNPDLGPRWPAYQMQYRVPPGDTEPPTSRSMNWDWAGPFQRTQQPLDNVYRNQGDFLTKITKAKSGQLIGTWTGRTTTFVNRYDQQGNIIGTANFPSRQRLDLKSRVSSLPPYPAVVNLDSQRLDPTTNMPEPSRRQLAQAIAARQKLARDIYFRLLLVCGLLDEDPVPITSDPPSWVLKLYPRFNVNWPPTGVRARVQDPTNPTDEELKPLRFLAQLAVNIVDFLDSDDYNTPFLFYTDMDGYPLADPWAPDDDNGNLKYWVFGTEKPRVVINEVLFEYQEPYDNNNKMRVNGPFDMRCWVELLNASGVSVTLGPDAPNAENPGAVAVDLSRYQIVIVNARNAGNAVDQLAGDSNGGNVLGLVPGQDIRTQTNDSDFLQRSPPEKPSPWTLNSNEALVIGPSGDTVDGTLAATKPPKWIQSDNLKFTLDRSGTEWKFANNVEPTKEYFVLLRRLAYPEMRRNQTNRDEVYTTPATVTVIPNTGAGPRWLEDFDPEQNPLVFNPYLTYDYTWVKQNQGLCDRTQDAKPNESVSWARTHPYADSRNKQHKDLDPTAIGNPTKTWHSLGRRNPPTEAEAPLLYHPDAALRTMDLLRVSAFKQHLLTQRFLKSDPSYPNYHYAPWFDEPPEQGQTARIYRALEFLEVTPDSLMNANTSAHRTVGKVNINTATPEEVFFVLTNPSQRKRWQAIYIRREAPSPPQPIYGFAPGRIDASPPPLPNGLSREDSWWRMDSGRNSQVFLDAFPNPNPDPLHEQTTNLFADLYDKITTRSNVFAVWCTVGFFEVDPNTGTLGPEIDADVGRQVRYRFFAIVDRTIIAEWMLQKGIPVETQLGRTDIDPRRPGPNGEPPPCVIYWSRIQ